ncbi:PREDICTED: cysteine and glycine-rich protein 1-like [Acropora digitifera]|uniref:cysteine and glycine-rich protein 1-like n=1 Tax=Acropora digitifera TaxID=70779 RepID=UPI00077B0A82|nr:PREDICTED: cysteine and glycine-rich protein 1-like [Acropora digitifera]
MPPKYGGGNTCKKCNKTVFLNEDKKDSEGGHWHTRCFTCEKCSKGLDSRNLCMNSGLIYCKTCYGEDFGPKGYGFGGGAGVLTRTK